MCDKYRIRDHPLGLRMREWTFQQHQGLSHRLNHPMNPDHFEFLQGNRLPFDKCFQSAGQIDR